MASTGQLGKIAFLIREAGVRRDEILDMASEVTGRTIGDFSELSQTEASELIERMEDEL